MSVYRYVRRAVADAAAQSPPSVEVTLTNPEFKAELDRTMDRMGFDFADSYEERLNAVAPGFPGAPAPSHFAHGADAEGMFADRPTPVARTPHATVPFRAF